MLGILVALKSILEFDAVATTISAASAGVTVSDLFDKLKSACKDDSIEYQTIQVLDRSLKEACIELGWAYDKLVVSETIDLGRMPDISVMTDSGLKNLFSKFVREEIDDDSLKVIVECFDKYVAESDKIHRYLDQKWKRYQNEKKPSAEIVQIVEKKHFTNKKLIAPFTREDSNAAQGGTYVERNDLLDRIERSFEEQAGRKRMVFLTGMGGCGKSELARAFADKHKDEYEEIFWLTCKDGVRPSLMDLFSESKTLCEVKREDAVRFSAQVLIIVDNCNIDDERFLSELSKETGEADFLITTRMPHMGSYEHTVPVESDDKDTFAYSVFEKNYCKKPRWRKAKKIDESEIESVREICREVQYNTMVVSLIGIRLREHNDLSIFKCANKIRNGAGKLKGNIKYSKDQQPRSEEIREIMTFLFSDILNYPLSDNQKEILTVLSLTPSYWYDIDFIISLCRGTRTDADYEDAVMTLLDFGWLQGGEERMSIHSLIAEAISDEQYGKALLIRGSCFFEILLDNYLGMPEQYLRKELALINLILKECESTSIEKKIAAMLLIKHRRFKTLFEESYNNVNAAYFVYMVHDGTRFFFYRDLENEKTYLLTKVQCQMKEGKRAVLLKIFNSGFPYKLDLSVTFFDKSIEIIPNGLCLKDPYLRECVFSKNTKHIGALSFYKCEKLSGALTLPEGLTSIESRAFKGCRGLNGDLNFPNSLTSVGDGAFEGCSGLGGKFKLSDSLTSIGDNVFLGCIGLNGKLTLPNNLTSIGDRAFEWCVSLNGELKLPNNLTSIGKTAFKHCSGIRGELKLPDSLTSIGDGAFSGCTGLSGGLKFPEDLKCIGDWAFSGCSGLNGELKFPEGLTSIRDWAFSGCFELSGELNFPEGLTDIGDGAFSGCSGFSGELKFPEGLTSIGDWAFSGCSGFSGELKLPEGVTNIGNFAFQGCSGLSGEMKLLEGVTSIEKSTFYMRYVLNGELRFPDSLTSIEDSAFKGCSELSGELKLPKRLTSIGNMAFEGCSGLVGDLKLPDGLKNIGDCAFADCIGLSGELKLSNGLISIGDSAFFGCSKLSGKLKLPNGLMIIGDMAFYCCFGLNGELKLPESLISIGNYAFEDCYNLSGDLELPDGLISIGDSAFQDCFGLNGELKLPARLTSIGEKVFEGCSGLKGKLIFPEFLTSIGNRAFFGCYGLNGDLIFPGDLTFIGDQAFYGCKGMSGKLMLPKDLTTIGDCAFEMCSGLSGELILPEGMKHVGNLAFKGCSGLSGELKLPESLTSIGDWAFKGCFRLSGELKLPKNLISIGKEAFFGCHLIEKITFYCPTTQINGVIDWFSSAIICGYKNSTAEEYARSHRLIFEELY